MFGLDEVKAGVGEFLEEGEDVLVGDGGVVFGEVAAAPLVDEERFSMAVGPHFGAPVEEGIEGEIGGGEVRDEGLGGALVLDVDVDASKGLGAGAGADGAHGALL